VINIVPLGIGSDVSTINLRPWRENQQRTKKDMQMKTMRARSAAALWLAATAATIGCAGSAHADPAIGPGDPQALTVTSGGAQPGLGHRAIQLNFTLQSGAGSCQLSGYPTVDALVQTGVDVDGAAPVHAKQAPSGYLGGAVPGTTVTLEPGHGAQSMVEWVAAGTVQDQTCQIYGPSGADVRLHVTPPRMSQTFTVPIKVGRSEGLCSLQVHPLAG
jgi:hypothetical protein